MVFDWYGSFYCVINGLNRSVEKAVSSGVDQKKMTNGKHI